MARLPIPGQDNGQWGTILNDFLLGAHKPDGSLKDSSISTAKLQDDSVTNLKLSTGVGTNNQVLTKDDTTMGGFKWATSPAGVTDHGALTGLNDDDHPQYHDDARGDARYYTQSQINTALAAKENVITGGSTTQYWRGDKTWQTLNQAAVGLANVDNTSDSNKPVSTAQAAANTADRARSNHTGTQPANTITGLATVATTGAYNDLTGKPTIPTTPSDIGALAIANNLSDVNNASTARTNLGVAIGSNVQAYSANLTTWAGKTAPTGTVIGDSDTQTLTSKRITKRSGTITSSATPTINTDVTDYYEITAQAAAITSFTTNLTGTPVRGDTLVVAITDNGTSRAITWGASFASSGTVALPTSTVISTRLNVGFMWNMATSKWDCVAVA